MTTPQQLKAIAEAQGFENVGIVHGTVHYTTDNGESENDHVYNPEHDRAQRDELLEWLGLRGWAIHYREISSEWLVSNYDETVQNKDRTTSILMAACKEVGV